MLKIPGGPTRRRLLKGATAAGLGLIAAPALLRHAAAQSWRAGDPFSLGVASGAPRSDGFVLWTRLAPEPLSTNPETPGGMRGGDVTVAFEIAADSAMRDVVRRGEATAEQAFAYSVHLDVSGLQPGRPYWYRFTSGDAASRIGRAVTLPAPARRSTGCGSDSSPAPITSTDISRRYRHLADENPDFVLFLGDYIYEYIEERRPTVRRHSDGIEAATLTDLPQSLRAISARSRPAAPACRGARSGHLGRPRGAGRLCRQMVEIFRRSGAVPASACGGVSGVLRAHAGAADPVAARRAGHADL